MKSAVVTGVSSGIGRAIARELMKRKFHVFGSARKEADAEALRAELGDAVTPLIFNVSDAAAVMAGVSGLAVRKNRCRSEKRVHKTSGGTLASAF